MHRRKKKGKKTKTEGRKRAYERKEDTEKGKSHQNEKLERRNASTVKKRVQGHLKETN